MENPVSQLVQDQNLKNIHSAGGASLGRKFDIPRAAKKGALGGRKALNDISNSGKPSTLEASKKHNSLNMIPVAKDTGGGSKNTSAVGGKTNLSKVPEKGKSRKALTDLTNSAKPSSHHLSKKNQEEKKLNVTSSAIKEEGFLHNHQECITAQRKGMNYEYFLESVGLASSGSPPVLLEPPKLKPESPAKYLEIEEEIPIPDSPRKGKAQFLDYSSSLPLYESPKSIKCSRYEFWMDEENLTADFKLIESPQKLLQKKHLI